MRARESALGRSPLLSCDLACGESVLVHPIDQGAPRQAEKPSRARAIAVARRKSKDNQRALDGFEGDAGRRHAHHCARRVVLLGKRHGDRRGVVFAQSRQCHVILQGNPDATGRGRPFSSWPRPLRRISARAATPEGAPRLFSCRGMRECLKTDSRGVVRGRGSGVLNITRRTLLYRMQESRLRARQEARRVTGSRLEAE